MSTAILSAGSRDRRSHSHLPPAPRAAHKASSLASEDQIIEQAGRYALLSAEQEAHLGHLIQSTSGDEQQAAIDLLMLHNLRLVWTIAKRFVMRDLMDAFQDGVIGLQVAAKKFDPRKGVRFCTYAHADISMHISRGCNPGGIPISLSSTFSSLMRRVPVYEAGAQGRSAESDEEVGRAIGLSTDYVKRAREIMTYRFVSLDATLPHQTHHTEAAGAFIPDVSEDAVPDEKLDAEKRAQDVHAVLSTLLSPRQLEIVCLRHGIGRVGGVELKAVEIAHKLGVNESWILQQYSDTVALIRTSEEAKRLFRLWLEIPGRVVAGDKKSTSRKRDPESDE